jgi:acyl-CoA reductase-like NAD-dependent aldehyde dehydrogenase
MKLGSAGAQPAAADEAFGLLIGGEWVRRSRTIEVRNPLDDRPFAAVTAGTAGDAAAAVGAAEAALRTAFPAHARGVDTGEHITRTAGIKKLSMELGSNSPVIVLPDADLGRAVPAIASGAFAQAGQNCLGVQRVFIHEHIYAEFKSRFTGSLRSGRFPVSRGFAGRSHRARERRRVRIACSDFHAQS